MSHPALFQSFFLGGFECSAHRIHSGKRRDLIHATNHDKFVLADYRRLREIGVLTARDGLRWHLIEKTPYRYDFSTVLPMVRAAQEVGIQVIWDLFHYGWPDDLDIFQPEFVQRYRAFAAAFTHLLANETDSIHFLSPVNEISYFSWAGGDAGYLNPFVFERSFELKAQLVRAAIEGIEAIWDVLPTARIVHADPVINVIADPAHPQARQNAEAYRLAQYQGWDMLSGRLWPLLGGHEKYLDILGVNYYDNNQWIYDGPFIDVTHPLYRPFSDILTEVYARYGRPLFISETGVEGDMRAEWLRYIGEQVHTTMMAGVPVEGICLYPICDYPGWDDERRCHTGLWGYADEQGERELHEPLVDELRRQQAVFANFAPASTRGMLVADLEKLAAGGDDIQPTICLFTDSLDPAEMGEHMLILAAQLQEHYRILFVCPPGEKGNIFLDRAETLGCISLPLAVQGNRSAAKTLQWWLHEMGVEIFHCHAGIGWEGHNGIQAAHEYGVPSIVRTEHLPYLLTEPQQGVEYKNLLTLVDRLICVSQEAAQSFVAAGIPPEKLQVIHSGIVPNRAEADVAGVCAEFGLPATAKIVLTVARMTEQKGHRYFLDAIPAIAAQVPDAYFIWVGEGPLERELCRQMKTRGIDAPRLTLAGRRADIPRLLAASDLFVLPSLFEGLPLVLLEAMAAGVPVVGTQVCGTREAITDGVNGRLVRPKDSPALAAAIHEALTHHSLTARWVQAGQQRFVQEFSAKRMATATIALYESLRTAEKNRDRAMVTANAWEDAQARAGNQIRSGQRD